MQRSSGYHSIPHSVNFVSIVNFSKNDIIISYYDTMDLMPDWA